MNRWWNEHVAALGDAIGLGTATLLLLVAAALVAAGWYWYPAWLHWRPRRFKVHLSWRRSRATDVEPEPGEEPERERADELPDLPAAVFVSLADRFAAEGRYAEAVRERLRAIVRELVDLGVLENSPGWTVTELARAAGTARPQVRPPLDGASLLFSDIWYGQRPAYAEHDTRMRGYATEVHEALLAGSSR